MLFIERQPAVRVFAEELTDCTDEFTESDEDRPPSFVTLPTGGKANQVFMAGTLTNVDDIGSDSEYWQARVVDPTGAVNVYAGEYQPEAMAELRQLEAPTYVAVTGKPRVYEPEDSDTAYVSVRPEAIQVVDEQTRETWVVETAAATRSAHSATWKPKPPRTSSPATTDWTPRTPDSTSRHGQTKTTRTSVSTSTASGPLPHNSSSPSTTRSDSVVESRFVRPFRY